MKCKRILSFALAAAMLFGSAALLPEDTFSFGTGIKASAAEVESGQCGENVFWSLDDKGVLTISGTGATYDYNLTTSPFENRNDIKSVIFESGVTTIGLYLFDSNEGSENTSIISVHISDTVTEIKYGNFSYYLNMESFTVDDNNPNYSSLDGILYNKNQTRIMWVPFKIKNISIPEGIESLSGIFSDHYYLESVIIPNSVMYLVDGAFMGCTKLKSIRIPSSIKSIGTEAFWDCSSLEKVTFGSGKTRLGESSFSGCEKLTELVIENDFSDFLGNDEWLNMSFGYVTKLGLGKGVSDFDRKIFDYYPKINEINVDPENPYYSSVDGVLYNKDKTKPICCPRSKTSVVIPDGVTEISDEAFRYHTNLKSIDLPDSLTSIGDSAFASCTSLESITIPDSVTSIGGSAFSGCKSLTSVTIPNSVTSIGGNAFEGCTSLESITIPDSVMTIGDEAFMDCTKLETINIPKSVVNIGKDAFTGTKWFADQQGADKTFVVVNGILVKVNTTSSIVTIPSSVKIIAADSFAGCSSVKAVTIPKSVVSIGNNAFENCTNLASITIPNSVKTIGESAFSGCANLASVSIPNSVTEIGGSAFSSCSKLTSIALPNSVKTLGAGAFRRCLHLSSIDLSNKMEDIGEGTFYLCQNLKSITIPGSVKTIGKGAFINCNSLEKVKICEGVTEIGERAFAGCEKLVDTTIELPASVKSLGVYAFVCDLNVSKDNKYFCSIDGVVYDKAKTKLVLVPTTKSKIVLPDTITSLDMDKFKFVSSLTLGKGITSISDEQFKGFDKLKSITLADTVTSIGKGAFEDCKSLQSINLPDSLTSIGDGAFMNCSSLKSIAVPDAVDNIGTYTFYFCSALESLKIGSGVKTIGDGAFSHCSNLTSITIGNNVETIGQYAFDGCTSLVSLSIPDSVKSIDYGAFISCEKLTEVTIPQSVNVVGGYAFGYLDNSKNSSINSGAAEFNSNINADLYTKVKGFTINCCKDSAGEKYAKTNGFKYTIVVPSSRLSGNNRFGTAAEIAKATYPTAETVILAFGLNYADALAGVPLAEKLKAPILLTNTKSIPKETTDAIEKLGAKNVIILGGEGAISKDVEKTLKKQGLKTKRLAGKTRFETAAAIAEEVNPNPTDVFFVYAFNSADALSVSTVAALKNAPIIYLSTKGDINADTAAYLAKLKEKGCVKNAYFIGGKGVISDTMAAKALLSLGVATGKRIAGQNRYETCVAVNDKFKSVLTGDGICVAKGLDFPDALAGGVYAAKTKQALFLADGKKLQDFQNTYLKSKNAGKITVFGGTGAVPDNLVKLIAQASV